MLVIIYLKYIKNSKNMCGRGQYVLIYKNVKLYPIVIVKKYRYLVLILCLLYVILKLYYSVIPTLFNIMLRENISEIQTVNSDMERQAIKNITKNSSASAFNEKQTIFNSDFSEKQTVKTINVNSVNDKQKVTNISVRSFNDSQTAINSTIVIKYTLNISDTETPTTVNIASDTKELFNKTNSTESVIVNKVTDKLPVKFEVIKTSKVKNTRNKKPVKKAKVKIPDISCHYSTQNDTLPSVEDPSFTPGDQPIFFHETSCRGGINNRQACVIESAARLHPQRQINLLFSAPITDSELNNSNLVHLLKIKNIKILRLHIEQYTNSTVVESLFKIQIKKSLYPIEHIADILRIVTLNKFGGVYLDTDSFLVKNLDSLPPNWIAEELGNTLSSGAMGFSVNDFGHNLTTEILKEIRNTYKPKSWNNNGPKAIQRVLARICPKTVKTTGDCKGLKIFPSKDFYPVHYKQHTKYFKKGKMDTMYQSYMHHMWNHLTMNKKIEKDSPYANLAKKLCPTIFATYGKEFGQ